MRALRLVTLAAVAAALAGGCTKHQTEMILVITTEGVRIPDDVHSLHLAVADRQASGDDPVYDADIALCNPMLSTACYDIPVTAVLYPGPSRGSDSVRVQVTANGATGPVIADAALFTFANEQSLHLDFVLYANCLGNVECAKRDQACGPLDTCIDLKPGPVNGPLDLSPAPSDLGGCGKLNAACCPSAAGAKSPVAGTAGSARRRIVPNVIPDAGTTGGNDMTTLPPDLSLPIGPDLSMVSFPDMTQPIFPDMAMLPPDLSMPPQPDFSMLPPPDFSMPPPPDLSTPPPADLSTTPPADLATSGGTGTCDPGLRCVSNVCVP